MRDIDSYHGDEPEIECSIRAAHEAYEDFHADDFKYTEQWLNVDE